MASSENDHLHLEQSGWHLEWDGTFYSFVAAIVALPLGAFALENGFSTLFIAAVVVAILGLYAGPLLGPPDTKGAYATHEVIRFKSGGIRSRIAEVPLAAVVDVWVDRRPEVLPDIGNITVQYGAQEYLHFPGVRHAEAVRRQLLARRDRALARSGQRPAIGTHEDPRRITMK